MFHPTQHQARWHSGSFCSCSGTVIPARSIHTGHLNTYSRLRTTICRKFRSARTGQELHAGAPCRGAPGLRPAAQKSGSDSQLASSAEGSPANRWEDSRDASIALAVLLGVLGLGQLSTRWQVPLLDLPYFVLLATVTIYTAAHRSTTNKTRQQISLKQGALAPIAASAALLGGYLIIKFFPQLSLQVLFNAYFGLLGSVAVAGAFQGPLRQLATALGQEVRLPLPRGLVKDESGKDLADEGITASDIAALLIGIAAASADVLCGHSNFTLNNLLACLIAVDLLGLIGLNSFRTAAVLLCGLLAYDVFWVFGSPKVVGDNVMLTVATSNVISGPVRLLFPRPLGGGEAASFPFALLGLGDIAVPGLLAGLALRYDLTRRPGALQNSALMPAPVDDTRPQLRPVSLTDVASTSDGGDDDSSDVYFWACMGAYLGGLLCAFAASTISHLGQPALLYIVPLMLSAVGGTALLQGELKQVFDYKEAKMASPFDKSDQTDKKE